jgi:DNA-binding GntR family transcriptional regulator
MNPSSQDTGSHSRLTRRREAYARILEGILNREYLPRERLLPSRIAEQLHMSRTPVREALQLMEAEGYVMSDVSGGMLVKGYTAREIEELYELREGLECWAIELACERMTEDQVLEASKCHEEMKQAAERGNYDRFLALNAVFHLDLLYGNAGNNRLREMIVSLRDRLLESRLNRASIAQDWDTKVRQHEMLIEAIKRRDRVEARSVLLNHLATALEVQKRWAH